jgi:glycosyltransferase involved in cell wall biosynthesis
VNLITPDIYAVLPGFNASTLMDVVMPLMELEANQQIRFRVGIESYLLRFHYRLPNLVVFCRNTEPKYQYIFKQVVGLNIPYIYDLDDDLFEVPLDTELGIYHRSPHRIALLRDYLSLANLVRVYSPLLQKKILQINPNVVLITPPLDWNSIKPSLSKSSDYPIKIVYVTSREDDRLHSIFLPALVEILNKYQDRVVVYFWGYLPKQISDKQNVHYMRYIQNYKFFLDKFSRFGFDIGLAPLFNDEFHRSKTNNKFREYASCGIAGVYSNVDVYASCIQDRKTGLLVSNNPDAWYIAISELIENYHLRKQISQAAYMEIKKQCSKDVFRDVWLKQICEVLENVQKSKSKATEVNLFFGSKRLQVDYKKQAQEISADKNWSKVILLLKRGKFFELINKLRTQLTSAGLLFKINYLKRL